MGEKKPLKQFPENQDSATTTNRFFFCYGAKDYSMFSPFRDQTGRVKATVFFYFAHLLDSSIFQEY